MSDRAELPGRPRCSAVSSSLAEPALATASTVRTWLLLEHAGAWASTALQSRHLPAGLGTELARRANAAGVRVVLLRKPGRTHRDRPPTCLVATTRATGSWLGRAPITGPADVLDLDLAALARGERAGYEPVDGPLFCVCTHGRHDPCCAERGRPVAAALAARFPERTWEVSHIGGDRFAGNVVCFPDGDYLGRLDAETAVPVLEAYVEGRYVLDHLRGRAGLGPRVQAAEVLARRELGVDARGAVHAVAGRSNGAEATVRLAVDGHGEVVVRLEVGAADEVRHLTCHAQHDASPPTYRLLSITPAS